MLFKTAFNLHFSAGLILSSNCMRWLELRDQMFKDVHSNSAKCKVRNVKMKERKQQNINTFPPSYGQLFTRIQWKLFAGFLEIPPTNKTENMTSSKQGKGFTVNTCLFVDLFNKQCRLSSFYGAELVPTLQLRGFSLKWELLLCLVHNQGTDSRKWKVFCKPGRFVSWWDVAATERSITSSPPETLDFLVSTSCRSQ